MKKNLLNNHLFSTSVNQSNGSLVGQITCEPCALECEKMNMKINGRKLSDIKNEEIDQFLNVFNKTK